MQDFRVVIVGGDFSGTARLGAYQAGSRDIYFCDYSKAPRGKTHIPEALGERQNLIDVAKQRIIEKLIATRNGSVSLWMVSVCIFA